MRMKFGFIAALGIVAIVAARASANMPPPPIDIAVRDNAFAFRLLNAVQVTSPARNVVISPVSAALDLAIALNGATGQTKQEMQTALSLDGLTLPIVNISNAQLIQTLRTPTKNVTMSVADSLWTDSRRATLRPSYVAQMRQLYDAELTNLDFGQPNAPGQINAWASKETRGKIPKVIDQIDAADVALLLNAVYFKGEWTSKFDKAKTETHDFTLADGSVRKVPRMSQLGEFDYFETKEMQAIRLPYGDGTFVMDVFLPARGSSLGALESDLTPEHWSAWQRQFAPQHGTIELPRFELKNDYVLNRPLQTLGMRQAFAAGKAQFTQMFESSREFFISTVLQSTYLKVDEEGSEAAAVTTITLTAAVARPMPPPFHMIVDRPFLCAIEAHRRTGVLLFIAAIYDPQSSN